MRRKQLLGFWAEFFYPIRIRICWRKFSSANIDSGRFPPMAQRYRNDSFWDQGRLEALLSANTNHPLMSQHTESKSQKRPLKITYHNKSHSTRPEAYTSNGKQTAHKRTKNICGLISTNSHKSYVSLIVFLCKFSSVQSLSRVQLFATPWTAARQASLSITNSWSPPKLMSIESMMPSNYLILCRPLLLPSIFPSIRAFSNESAHHIRWPTYWGFSFSISPTIEHPGLISFRMDWLDLLAVQGTLKSLLQHHSWKASIFQRSAFFIVQLSHPYMTTGKNRIISSNDVL